MKLYGGKSDDFMRQRHSVPHSKRHVFMNYRQRERPVLESTLENAEAIADALITNDVVKELPVVGTFFKMYKGIQSFRDRVALARLEAFVSGTGTTPEVGERWRQKLAADPEEAQSVGETLLFAVERSEDRRKAELLGLLFVAYVNGALSSGELRRLSKAVDLGFMDDLEEFLKLISTSFRTSHEDCRQAYPASEFPFVVPLSGTGLTRLATLVVIDADTPLFYVTPLGYLLSNMYRYANQWREEHRG